MSYPCPACVGKTRVVETRAGMRVRQCENCKYRFFTEESVVWPTKDGYLIRKGKIARVGRGRNLPREK